MYVVVRRDMPIGLQMAQACHAAFSFALAHPAQTADWHRTSQYLVVVTVENEVELMRLANRASTQRIRHLDWHEPDMDDELTAVALAPGIEAQRLCANLPLAGKPIVDTGVAVG